jgi:hypothetical protein
VAIVKTTLEIPDPLFRKAKARAAERGQSLKDCTAELQEARLAPVSTADIAEEPKWMGGFGKLRQLRKETARIQCVIDETFGSIERDERGWSSICATGNSTRNRG